MKTKLLRKIRKRIVIYCVYNCYYLCDYDNSPIHEDAYNFWYTKSFGYKQLESALSARRGLILRKARELSKRLSKQVKIYER